MTTDLFADTGTPTLKFTTIGDTHTGTIVSIEEMHSRKYNSTDLAYWDDGKPKKTIRIVLDTPQGQGSIWAGIPSALRTAIIEAKGANQIEIGGTLAIKFVGTEPVTGYNDRKLYKAQYSPPVATPVDVDNIF